MCSDTSGEEGGISQTTAGEQAPPSNPKTTKPRCRHYLSRGPHRHPRCWSILCAIFIPLWVLIGCSVLGGYILAGFEAPVEVEANDAILANRHIFVELDWKAVVEKVLKLPQFCFDRYLQDVLLPGKNMTDIGPGEGVDWIDWWEGLDGDTSELLNDLFDLLEDMREFMETCGNTAQEILEQVWALNSDIEVTLAAQPLSFNWIRCWNRTELGDVKPFNPTDAQIEAAASQSDFYERVWREDQVRIYREYLAEEEYPNSIEARLRALRYSADNASGGDHCGRNTSGTAWFWFIVMTTVGYGNQSPITAAGRAMVGTLGFASILAFGGILANAGSIVAVLWDDFIERSGCKSLQHPVVGCAVWGCTFVIWMFFLANSTLRWWQDRLVDGPGTWEGVWYAYISITTIGLGDFFLQPEVVFLIDVFRHAGLFLTGFVFLSTFLGKLVEVVGRHLPSVGENLSRRLGRSHEANTSNPVVCEPAGSKSALIGMLSKALKDEDGVSKELSTVIEEEELLQSLLEEKRTERRRLELGATTSIDT